MRAIIIGVLLALSATMAAAQPPTRTPGTASDDPRADFREVPHTDSPAVLHADFWAAAQTDPQAALHADSPAVSHVDSRATPLTYSPAVPQADFRTVPETETDSHVVPHRFSGAVSVGMGIALNQPASTPLGWQAVGYYNPCVRFAVGAGVGMSFYEKTLIPLFADVKFLLTRPRRFTPYLECGAGYAFAPSSQANGGLYLNPSVGVQYAFRSGPKLFFAAGYELQRMERLRSHSNPWFAAEMSEQLRHNSLSLRLGVLF